MFLSGQFGVANSDTFDAAACDIRVIFPVYVVELWLRNHP